MKPLTYLFPFALGLVLSTSAWAQNDEPKKPKPKEEKVMPRTETKEAMPRPKVEKQAFLGVATMPMEPVLRAHLNLDPGVGLIVQHVDPDSAAAGVLQSHDVLTYFEDQQLINHDQLAVLVRNAGAGAKVNLTVLRGGKSMKKQVELGERESPMMPDHRRFGPEGWNFHFPMPHQERWEHRDGDRRYGHPYREHRDFQPKGSGPAPQPKADKPKPDKDEKPDKSKEKKSDAEEASTISVSSLPSQALASSSASSVVSSTAGEEIRSAVWVDQDMVLHFSEEGGSRSLAIVQNGAQIFNGPVNTADEQEAIPADAKPAFQRLLKQLGE